MATHGDVSLPASSTAWSDRRLPPEEENELRTQADALKTGANGSFVSGDLEAAIAGYNRALAVLPIYLEFDVAVLKCNLAACSLKLEQWKDAIESASAALTSLELLDPTTNAGRGDDNDAEVGRMTELDEWTAAKVEAFYESGRSLDDVRKLRLKALLRRAKARSEAGGWANLDAANEDYKQLAASAHLTPLDKRTVEAALRALPLRLQTAKESEMADMMGKLKQLGNGILKPFGLSTENFNMIKDENTGGYNLQFNGNK